MKVGRSPHELLVEIQRRAQSKEDFLVPTGKAVALYEEKPLVAFGDRKFELTSNAHGQLAEFAGIPFQYYKKIRDEQPELWVDNVNTWLKVIAAKRMIRTLDGKIRAFLSDRFRALENEDLAAAVLPVLQELGVVIMSAEVTDDKFYLKAVDERIAKDVPTGHKFGDGFHHIFDTLSPAIVISNSEVGKGRLNITTSVFTKACTNLASIDKAGSIRRSHVGSKLDAVFGEEDYGRLLSDETKRLNDAALWNTARDVVRGMFERQKFEALVDETIVPTTERKIEGAVDEVVKVSAKRFGLTDTETNDVLKALIEGGSLTQYGLSNAITRASQDVEDYERASELEKIGGDVIQLPASDWKVLAKAA